MNRFTSRLQNRGSHFLELHHRAHFFRKGETRQVLTAFFLRDKDSVPPPQLLRPELPFLLKLMPLQDIGKKVQVEACLFAQHRHTGAIFQPSGLLGAHCLPPGAGDSRAGESVLAFANFAGFISSSR
jgi:hypothetical protein